MKQNERWLVYAVTGFLALILVVAVLSSRPAENTGDPKKLQGLNEILNPATDKKTEVGKVDASAPKSEGLGVPDPNQVSPQPLVAQPKAMLAADVVTQALGPSTREFTVRKVWVKQNDSLESLVRRWCGVDRTQADEVRRLVDETKKLNEELAVLKAGTQIVVPWVEDDVLAAAIEAQKPKTLVAEAGAAGAGSSLAALVDGSASNPATNTGTTPAVTPSPAFAMPGNTPANANGGSAVRSLTTGGTKYTVKSGESLWRIADRTYGRKNADRMVAAIKAANPGLGDDVRAGKEIVLPKDEKSTAQPAGQ